MTEYSIYEIETGRLTGARIAASRSELIVQTLPDGIGIVPGAWDHLTHVVDPETGDVLSCEPPPENWRLRQGVMASAQYQIILSAETAQARPLRDILAAQLAGLPPNPDDMAIFHALKARIDAARLRSSAILGAQTSEDLDALVQTP